MEKRIVCLTFLFFISCKDAVKEKYEGLDFYFENPQPVNDSELSKFPDKFQGTYFNTDSTSVTIGDKLMVSEHDYGFKVHKKDLDSIKDIFEFINGKLIDKETISPLTAIL